VSAALETTGTPIKAYDLLIAGQALRRRLPLVTADVREFGRVVGLARRDWAS
jgi:tRNA(fMet)-specific endonuclease VapC